MRPDRQRLERRLGYHFRQPDLLETALTHRSAGRRNNERLEFLGDAILGFVISEALFERFPEATEGQLSRMRSHLVRGETLAELARELELGEYLILGAGELKSGGYRRESTLADAFEALIGAIYRDNGLDAAREFVLAHLQPYIERLDPTGILKDPKTRLQELMQARGLPLPGYEVKSVQGKTHEQQFEVVCHVEGLPEPVRGTGGSRRKAEQAAAAAALERLESP